MAVLGRWVPAAVRRPAGVVEGMRWLYLLAAVLALLLTLPAPLAVANPVLNGHPAPAAAIIGPIPALFLVGIVGRMLGASLFVREESARRDAALAAAGTDLLAARDRPEILALADRASAEICAATPGLRSIAVFPNRDGAMTTFPNGTFVQQPTTMPETVIERDADGRARTVRDPRFLNALAGTACVWLVIPTPSENTDGYVLLGAPKQVPNEAVLAMTSMLNQVAFAIRNWQDRQSLTVQARTDALTGLANRAAFAEALEQAAGSPPARPGPG